MKVLITGSSGSLGSIIAKNLIAKEIHVIGLDLKDSGRIIQSEYFTFYQYCITDKDCLESVFKKEEPTHVIHLACTFNKIRSREREYEIDVGGSRNLLEVTNKTRSVKQLIYLSSASAYGCGTDNPEWIGESQPLRPGNYRYGLNKKLVEEIYLGTPLREDLNINIVRACLVIGPSFKPSNLMTVMKRWSWLPEFCRETRLQFLHSDDFVSVIDLMIPDKEVKGVFNLAPDSYSVVKDLCPGMKYVKFPVSVITGFLAVLWYLRLMNLHPAGINYGIYPIIIDPGKLISRYGYKFKYSSTEAFENVGIG